MWSQQFTRFTRLISPPRGLLLNMFVSNFRSVIVPRNFSILSNVTVPPILPANTLLQPASVALNFDRGFKVKGKIVVDRILCKKLLLNCGNFQDDCEGDVKIVILLGERKDCMLFAKLILVTSRCRW